MIGCRDLPALLLSLLLAVPAAHAQSDAAEWQAVGRLDTGPGSFCTGTLIAEDLVLAPAHCVYDGRLVANPRDLSFRAGLTGGTAIAERAVAQIEVHPAYFPNALMNTRKMRHDVALIRLATPVPAALIAPLPVLTSQVPQGPVDVAAYGEGRGTSLSHQAACVSPGRKDRLIAVDCDGAFGTSGAPVFLRVDGRLQIASILSGEGQFDGKKVALGPELAGLLDALTQSLRTTETAPRPKVRRIGSGSRSGAGGAKFVRPGGS